MTTIEPAQSHVSAPGKIARIILMTWLVLSMVSITLLQIAKFEWQFLVPYWLIACCVPLWHFRHQITTTLQNWRAPDWLKFFLLAYGMVLFEETFSALFNHLSEGFNFWIFIQRIGQFWAFNVLAFTGLILATWLLYSRVQFTQWEMFCLIGFTGLFSERIIYLLPNELIGFLTFAPTIFIFYGFILSPALMSMKLPPRRVLHPVLKYALMLLAWTLLSQPPGWLLASLRIAFPVLFPSCDFIPCG
jgi:hypothetical protein